MIDINEKENITIYSGYGFSAKIPNYENPITHTARKDVSIDAENRLIGIKYLENKDEFMISFPSIPIKSDLFTILNQEIEKAECFVTETNEIIKKNNEYNIDDFEL